MPTTNALLVESVVTLVKEAGILINATLLTVWGMVPLREHWCGPWAKSEPPCQAGLCKLWGIGTLLPPISWHKGEGRHQLFLEFQATSVRRKGLGIEIRCSPMVWRQGTCTKTQSGWQHLEALIACWSSVTRHVFVAHCLLLRQHYTAGHMLRRKLATSRGTKRGHRVAGKHTKSTAGIAVHSLRNPAIAVHHINQVLTAMRGAKMPCTHVGITGMQGQNCRHCGIAKCKRTGRASMTGNQMHTASS